MKKRLLITSIVMMLVVAVALSTATYAWFTSSASVRSSSITMTAATNNAASLGISWTDGNYGPSITAYDPNTVTPTVPTFQPACPTELTVSETSIGDPAQENNNIAFYTAFATPKNGDMVFQANGATTPVYTWTDDASSTHTNFYVKNLSPANDINHVTITANISGTGAGLVRVAVFKYDTTAGYYKLMGILANQEPNTYTAVSAEATLTEGAGTYFKKYLGKYVPAVPGSSTEVTNGTADYEINATVAGSNKFYTKTETATNASATYGTIAINQSVNAMATRVCTDATVGIDLGALEVTNGVGASHNLKVLVWEDAVALGDAEGAQQSTVDLVFTAG